jgi:hypothetical protein
VIALLTLLTSILPRFRESLFAGNYLFEKELYLIVRRNHPNQQISYDVQGRRGGYVKYWWGGGVSFGCVLL